MTVGGIEPADGHLEFAVKNAGWGASFVQDVARQRKSACRNRLG
jgi:hypothetical protein